jgi:hypothetical protein
VQRANEQVGINIIVATGLYTFNEIPHLFHYRSPGTILDGPELMTEMFVNDIRHGMASSRTGPASRPRSISAAHQTGRPWSSSTAKATRPLAAQVEPHPHHR